MAAEEFSVGLEALDPKNLRPNGSLVRQLNVVAKDPVKKTITVKYGGAYSGTYAMVVSSSLVGKFRVKDKFVSRFEFTDFNPKKGSKFGGQLITIQGSHFSSDPLNNPIKIGYEYTSGVIHYCDVLSSSEFEIKCRMRLDANRKAGKQELIVFASTYEEAKCRASTCTLEFLDFDQLPTVEVATASYDVATGKNIITVNGFGISDTSTSTIQAYIGGREQVIRSVKSTEVVIEVANVASGLQALKLELFFWQGAPNNLVSIYSGRVLKPAFHGLATPQGSECGSKITAIVSGLGEDDTAQVQLVNAATSASICSSQKITAYGVLECETNAAVYSTAIGVALKVSGQIVSCIGFGGKACSYSTFANKAAFTAPTLTSDNEITISGSNYALTGTTGCSVIFAGRNADSCTITANTAVAVYSAGVPLPIVSETPSLFIETDNAGRKMTHRVCGTDKVAEKFTAPTVTQENVSCSFAGGCKHGISISGTLRRQLVANGGNGLTANVAAGKMKVLVCGEESTLLPGLSDASASVFTAPAIKTQASQLASGRSNETIMIENEFASLASLKGVLFDGNNVPGLSSSGSNCAVGFKLTQPTAATYSKIAMVSEFRFFMDYFTNKALYAGTLKFQGSNDGFVNNINTLVTVGEEIHEGWNSYDLSNVAFSSFRIFNPTNNGCDAIGEIKLFGQVVLDFGAGPSSCDVKIVDVTSNAQFAVTQTI